MHKLDAVLIGNAIVDMIEQVDDATLADLAIEKGIMQLVDSERSSHLYAAMKSPVQTAGGSAANTAAVMAALGHSVHYISKTAEDVTGKFFHDDMNALGVRYDTPRSLEHATGRSMIFVTPDGERSMNTYLGASEYLEEQDVDLDSIWEATYLYLEGYRFDGPASQEAFKTAVERCKANDGIATVTLSDPFCVERHRQAFHDLIEHGIDLVFANEAELMAYTQTETPEAAREKAQASGLSFATTAGANGAYVIHQGEVQHVPAQSVEIVDATGAGDYFAGAFLAGLLEGKTYREAAEWGCIAAAEVIQVVGTRIETDLRALLK